MSANSQERVKLLRYVEKPCQAQGEGVHSGWIRATAILLRGLERLRAIEERNRQ